MVTDDKYISEERKPQNKMDTLNYEVCDAHAHIFPEPIAGKAVNSIGDFYSLDMFYSSGSPEALLEGGKKINTTHYLVCSVATVPHQVQSINKFILSECEKHPEFVGLGTLHPDCPDTEQEIEKLIASGIKGIKLHPDFQRFNIDDKKAMKIYEMIEGRLPVLIHMGDSRYDYSRPYRLENVIKAFPKLKVIAAHLGGYERWEEAITCLYSENVYFDTSSSLAFISPEFAKELILTYGEDRIFFGTDFPMWDHVSELERFLSLGLDEKTNRKILADNFKKFFGIE